MRCDQRYGATGDSENEPQPRDGGSTDSSIAIPVVIGGLGVILTGGLGGLSAQIALASLRIATATFYIGATGGAAVGTGFVVVKGGKLVVQKARPGAVATVKAANRAARDARASLQQAAQTTAGAARALQGTIAERRQFALASGSAVGQHTMNSASGIGNKLVRLVPSYRVILDPRIAGQGQAYMSLVIEDEEHAQTMRYPDGSGDLFMAQERDDGFIELQKIGRLRHSDGQPQETEALDAGPSTAPSGFEIVDVTDMAPLDRWKDLNVENEDGFVEIEVQSEDVLAKEAEQLAQNSTSDTESFQTAQSAVTVLEDVNGDIGSSKVVSG